MSIKIRGLNKGNRRIKAAVQERAEKTMVAIAKDLERVASETAPLDEGDLEMGGTHDTEVHGQKIESWVRFEAWNDNPRRSYDFNYAIWIHEEHYDLGPKSRAKTGGYGMSGKKYPVGRKYLTRPLEGEAPTYRDLLERDIKINLQKMK